MAHVDGFVLLKREQEFSSREIVLIVCWQPDTGCNLLLFHRNSAAAIDLSEDAAAHRNVAQHMSFSPNELIGSAIHPDLGRHMAEGVLKHRTWVEVWVRIELDNVAFTAIPRIGGQPFG